MPRVTLTNTDYTQVNTSTDSYLTQNLGPGTVQVIVSDTAPAADADPEFVLNQYDGIGSNDVQGTVWAKASHAGAVMGLVEG